MNEYKDDRKCCCFHPRVMVVGVCAMCLNKRLLVLASQQQTNNSNSIAAHKRAVPKIFALTSLLNRLDHNKQKQKEAAAADDDDDEVLGSSSSESFISIKFEDNGVASWDKGKISKMPQDDQQHREMSNWDEANKMKSVVIEHVKPGSTLRWRRRIGHLFHLIRWRRSSRGNACQGGGNVNYGWISILTKSKRRRTTKG